MKDIKSILAKNLTDLRLQNHLTQLELAEKLNYSDKTISKWERGESSPDISVLVEIAELFGVTLDELVKSEGIEQNEVDPKPQGGSHNCRAVSCVSKRVGWVVAVVAFVIVALIAGGLFFLR